MLIAVFSLLVDLSVTPCLIALRTGVLRCPPLATSNAEIEGVCSEVTGFGDSGFDAVGLGLIKFIFGTDLSDISAAICLRCADIPFGRTPRRTGVFDGRFLSISSGCNGAPNRIEV